MADKKKIDKAKLPLSPILEEKKSIYFQGPTDPLPNSSLLAPPSPIKFDKFDKSNKKRKLSGTEELLPSKLDPSPILHPLSPSASPFPYPS